MRVEPNTATLSGADDSSGWLWRIRRLTLREVRLLLEAQWLLVYCQVLRRRRPVGQLLTLDTEVDPRPIERHEIVPIRSVTWALTRAARYGVFRPRCLVRSLALQRMLRRHGVDGAEIRIGVRFQDGEFGAHAWIELDGRVLGDSPQHVQTFALATDLRLVQL